MQHDYTFNRKSLGKVGNLRNGNNCRAISILLCTSIQNGTKHENQAIKKQACIFLFERLIKPSFLEAICCCSRDKKNKYDFSGNEKPFQLCWEHSKKRKETAVFFSFYSKANEIHFIKRK